MLVRRNDKKLPIVESLPNLTPVVKYLCRFLWISSDTLRLQQGMNCCII